jgi:desulfoferrodoxin (superoxide reductase-like protein)
MLDWIELSKQPDHETMELFKEAYSDPYLITSKWTATPEVWKNLSSNPAAIDLLQFAIDKHNDNRHNIDWIELAYNPNPDVFEFIDEHVYVLRYMEEEDQEIFWNTLHYNWNNNFTV